MIARVLPRRTKATPVDLYSFHTEPGWFIPTDITEVHVSVTFTWDMKRAEYLAKAWKHIAPVKIGGPATGTRGEDFILVHNGDIIDGIHHKSTTQISHNINDQKNLALEMLSPIVSLPHCKGYYQIRGTEAHAGQAQEYEENIAQQLGAI
ncbi:hypothetical protein LCGC14_3075130, partial [marine sediment metagenome]